jgi:hypothetical protein
VTACLKLKLILLFRSVPNDDITLTSSTVTLFSPPARGYSTRLLLGDCDNVNLGGSSQFDRDRSFVFVAPPTDVRLAQGLSG